jgi:hypothetical protein
MALHYSKDFSQYTNKGVVFVIEGSLNKTSEIRPRWLGANDTLIEIPTINLRNKNSREIKNTQTTRLELYKVLSRLTELFDNGETIVIPFKRIGKHLCDLESIDIELYDMIRNTLVDIAPNYEEVTYD